MAIVAAIIILTLSACAGPHIYLWAKPGASYDDYLKDRYACLQDARVPVSSGFMYNGVGSMSSGQAISLPVMVSCLSAKGWVESPTGFAPPPGAAVYAH
jgi:hypothetical protein